MNNIAIFVVRHYSRIGNNNVRQTQKSTKKTIIVQELAINKRHQAYRIAAIVQNAPMKPKS